MLQTATGSTDRAGPGFPLNHGQVLWVLASMGFAAGVTATTFNYYIKSLRKLGVPFGKADMDRQSGRLAKYSFAHTMEVSLALTLRVYGTLPDAVLAGLIEHRHELYRLYDAALAEATDARGTAVRVAVRGHPTFRISGVYLDLGLRYAAGRLLGMGPPKAVTAYEALHLFATSGLSDRAHLPLNLSAIALNVAEQARRAPRIRRGPAPTSAE